MTIRVIVAKDIEEYITNPKLLEEKHHCRSLTGKLYMLTFKEKDINQFDKLLRKKAYQTRNSLLEEYGVELGDNPVEFAFVAPVELGLNKSVGIPSLTKSALEKKGIEPLGLYEINNKNWNIKRIKDYLN